MVKRTIRLIHIESFQTCKLNKLNNSKTQVKKHLTLRLKLKLKLKFT